MGKDACRKCSAVTDLDEDTGYCFCCTMYIACSVPDKEENTDDIFGNTIHSIPPHGDSVICYCGQRLSWTNHLVDYMEFGYDWYCPECGF